MSSQSTDQQKGNGKAKHKWTPLEDEKLVECMVELCVSGKMKCDNGFKPGTYAQIEKFLEEKLPGSGIKASPHIESRVKTLKKQYNALSDMLATSSGFAWDEANKMVVCEKALFEGWVKSHPGAQGMYMKPFPHFESLGHVFGKDRASGKGAGGATDFIEELDQNDTTNNYGLDDIDASAVTEPHISPPSEVEASNQSIRKRKRKNDAYLSGFTEMVSAMTKTAEAMDKLVGCLGESDPLRKVYDEVSKITGLSNPSKLKASQIIMGDPIKLNLLFSLPEGVKKEWVEELLSA